MYSEIECKHGNLRFNNKKTIITCRDCGRVWRRKKWQNHHL